jgi:hypothetical protein
MDCGGGEEKRDECGAGKNRDNAVEYICYLEKTIQEWNVKRNRKPKLVLSEGNHVGSLSDLA